MRILHIANNDKGGAANAMLTLHYSLLATGVESKVLVLNTNKYDKTSFSFLDDRRGLQIFKDSFNYRLFKFKRKIHQWWYHTNSNFTYYNGPYNITEHFLCKWADVINLHWYHNFINLEKLIRYSSKPIVFTMHDENLFLGGYHYTFDKKNSDKKSWTIDERYAIHKRKILSDKGNLHYVAPSMWLYNLLVENNFNNRYHISYGINSNQFHVVDQSIARKQLGFENGITIYLMLADHLESKRKGVDKAIKAFTNISPEKTKLVIAGNCNWKIEHSQIEYLGYVNGIDALSTLYSAVDATVVPTLADNLPNTVLESLACGTPVIGFDTGGMRDMVDSTNGILLQSGDFNLIFDNNSRSAIKNLKGVAIREKTEKQFSVKNQERDYHQLYLDIL